MSEPSFSPDKFDAQFQRILEATGCKTQVELADILEVRQSAISDAKRRMTIPSNWLETLHKKQGINPEWIRHGVGEKCFNLSYRQQGLHVVKTVEFRPLEECSLRDIIRELVRRIWQEPDLEEIKRQITASCPPTNEIKIPRIDPKKRHRNAWEKS